MSDSSLSLAELLSRRMVSWRSIEIVAKEERNYFQGPGHSGKVTMLLEVRYVETSSGSRYYDSRDRCSDGSEHHTTYYCDGKRCASIFYDTKQAGLTKQRMINIRRSFGIEGQFGRSNRPDPFCYFFAGKTPLYAALPTAAPLGGGEHLGRKTERFLFASLKWGAFPQDLVFHLDQLTGTPLKVEAFRDRSARQAESLLWRWQAKSIDETSRMPLPLASEFTEYAMDSSQATYEKCVSSISISRIEFDRSYPQSFFWPVIQPGVRVLDAVANKFYRTPGGAAEKASPAPSSHSSKPPIRASSSADWSLGYSLTSLVIGVVLVIAGVILWVRRR